MEGQMSLFDCGEVIPSDEALQARRTRSDTYHDALKYGHVAATKAEDYQALCIQLNGYADGVAIGIGLDAAEREMVANYAFAGADPVMQGKQH